MHFVYIIESLSDGTWYVGSSSDVKKRLSEHNSGKTRSTKSHIPYKLSHIEEFENKSDALKRERLIKKIRSY
ncbi:MAG: GIY-YIG nuclease family protein [bacterium]